MTQLALLSIGGAVAAYFVIRFLFTRDTAVENRRLEAIELSDACTRNGLPILGKALKRYSVGDYSGLAFAVRDIRDTISDPDELENVVNRFLGIQLDKKLRTVEGRETLVKAIEDRLGVEIPRDVIRDLPKRKLVTEEQAADEADAAVDAVLAAQPPQQG
jgi:hypothetical protein